VASEPSPQTPLYSPMQVGCATALGAPIAGCWLMASNFRELGEPVAARRTLVWGGVFTVLALALAQFLPDGFPSTALPVAYTFVVYRLAKQHQGTAFEQHLAAGGRKHSFWRAAGIGVGFLAGLVGVIFAAIYFFPLAH